MKTLITQTKLDQDNLSKLIFAGWKVLDINSNEITRSIHKSELVCITFSSIDYLVWRKINQVVVNKKTLLTKYQGVVREITSFDSANYKILKELYEEQQLNQQFNMQVISLNKNLQSYLKTTGRTQIPEDLDYILDNYAFRYDIQVPKDTYKESKWSYYNGGYHRQMSVEIGSYLLERLQIYDSIQYYLSIDEPFDVYEDEEELEEGTLTSQRIKYYGNPDMLDALLNYQLEYLDKGNHNKRMEVHINGLM